jgi:hypothetical protein
MKPLFSCVCVVGWFAAGAAAGTWTRSANAQETVTTPAPPVYVEPAAPVAPVERRTDVIVHPNYYLLSSGITTFGISYVPSVVVASESSHPGDRDLFVPVAGPWIDLGHRPGCAPSNACDTETAWRVLLAVDGVFQALGALEIVGGVIFPTRHEIVRTVTASAKPKVHFLPAQLSRDGYGVAALGTF